MERIYEVEVEIRKGLGPDLAHRTVSVGLDDIEPGTSEDEIRSMVESEVDDQLRRSEDYPLYGKTWRIVNINPA